MYIYNPLGISNLQQRFIFQADFNTFEFRVFIVETGCHTEVIEVCFIIYP